MATMKTRRIIVLVAGVGLTVAACGTSDSSTSSSPPASAETADDAADSVDEPADPTGAAEQVDTVATQPVDESAPGSDVLPTQAPTDDEPVPAETEAPAGDPAAPEVGGRVLASEVRPESQFAGNPFPDLIVNDVGRGGQANLANLLPSDRPLLLWAWAPH